MIVPAALRPGDRVTVIAPSGPFDPDRFARGRAWLEQHFQVAVPTECFEREGFLAGDDAHRLRSLNQALRDPETKAVFAARGGYGLTRIAHCADLGALTSAPKWLVGFSDFTALHLELARRGIASVHGPNVTTLAVSTNPARQLLLDVLANPEHPRAYSGTQAIVPGRTSGTLVGGNLTLIASAALSGRLMLPEGCILLLEEIGEAPYRIDRLLTTLQQGGHWDTVGGFALGSVTDSGPGPHGVTAATVLEERLTGWGVPVLAGLPIGHGDANDPIVLGGFATLDADALTLRTGTT